MVENRIEAVSTPEAKSPAADLALLVEKTVAEKQPVEAKIMQVPLIKEAAYIDPLSEDYKIKRENISGTIKNRESKDGIKSIHDAFHIMGDQPDWG